MLKNSEFSLNQNEKNIPFDDFKQEVFKAYTIHITQK